MIKRPSTCITFALTRSSQVYRDCKSAVRSFQPLLPGVQSRLGCRNKSDGQRRKPTLRA